MRTLAVVLEVPDASLEGDLSLPESASGVVLFAHGSGSSRHSPRNRRVAEALQQAGLGTLLIDLLTTEEERADERTAHLRFDIGMLARRVGTAAAWLRQDPRTSALQVGCFGASTGGGAALVAAADQPGDIAAVVSRGGRPDLAGAALRRVQAPTLLVVGSLDREVLRMNRDALEALSCPRELTVVEGATHLFQEPGTLAQVAGHAAAWFSRWLGSPTRPRASGPDA